MSEQAVFEGNSAPSEQPNIDRLNYLSNSFEDNYPSLGEHNSIENSSDVRNQFIHNFPAPLVHEKVRKP